MDKIDHHILSCLQRNARLSITELAEEVGLSVSPCHRRLRVLEEQGVIQGYHAALSRQHLGLNFSAIVFITLREANQKAVAEFEAKLESVTGIVEAQRLFGDPDYLVKVLTRDLESFRILYDTQLSALPNVLRLNSTLIMKEIVTPRALTMV